MAIETHINRQETTLGLGEFKQKFDPQFGTFMDAKIREFKSHSDPSRLADYMDYVGKMAEKGKRVRPYLAYLAYSAFGGDNPEQAIQSFLPLEIFHTFSLIHDDVMDNGQMRRGMQTLQAHITNQLNEQNPDSNHDQLGKSFAILLGDLMLAWAHESISSDPNLTKKTREKVQENFREMIGETARGQAIDLDLTTRDNATADKINEKNRLKTASPIIRSLLMGAILAGTDTPKVTEFCNDFGFKLGIMYQAQDDLLDAKGNPFDKTTLLDVAQKQHTYLTLYISEKGTEEQKSCLKRLLGKTLTEKETEEIHKLFVESGAILSVKQLVERLAAEAQEAIEKLQIADVKKQGFHNLLDTVSRRRN